jgi:hypothetical protein
MAVVAFLGLALTMNMVGYAGPAIAEPAINALANNRITVFIRDFALMVFAFPCRIDSL